jgi:hypothetical protein
MTKSDDNVERLRRRTIVYQTETEGVDEMVEDFNDIGKLG